jgi:hypothetical protein
MLQGLIHRVVANVMVERHEETLLVACLDLGLLVSNLVVEASTGTVQVKL